MDKKFKVAVIGATGAVGQVFMWMLSDHPWFELSYVTASAARVGQKYAATVHWVMPFEMPDSIREMEVREFNFEAMKKEGVQIVFEEQPEQKPGGGSGDGQSPSSGNGAESVPAAVLVFGLHRRHCPELPVQPK